MSGEVQSVDTEALESYYEYLAETNPLYRWLDLRLEDVEPGRLSVHLPYDEKVETPSPPAPPSIHGGVLGTVIDVSAVGAIYTTLDEPRGIVTTDASLSFHDGVQCDVVAEGTTVDVGSTLGSARVRVTPLDGSDEPVATGSVTCRLL
ncbi:MAG: PaaI family thioesterase [Halodesulfurarchaeum sp.]